MKKTSTSPLLDQLGQLDEALASAVTRRRGLARRMTEQAAAVEQIRRERVAAFSQDDERAATALRTKEQDAAEQSAELALRYQGAEVAEQRLQAERNVFVSGNHAAIVRERQPMAAAAAAAVTDAVAGLVEAVAGWNVEAQVQHGLLRVARPGASREIPDLAIVQVVADLERAVVPTPEPVGTGKVAEAAELSGVVSSPMDW